MKGLATLRRGLARWPDHFYLLWIGVWLSRRAGDRALDAECSARLLALAPDDPMVHRLWAKGDASRQVGRLLISRFLPPSLPDAGAPLPHRPRPANDGLGRVLGETGRGALAAAC